MKYALAFQMVESAANSGAPCPTNEVLAEAMNRESGNSGGNAMRYFEDLGLIRVQRFNRRRIVTIVATGKQTADERRNPFEMPRERRPSVARAIEQPAEQRVRKNSLVVSQAALLRDAERATLPHAPCWRCGARGACNHRHPDESFAAPRQAA